MSQSKSYARANKGIFGWGEWDGQSKAIGQVIDEKFVSVVTYQILNIP